MFERFTDDARKAMLHARASAAARNAHSIEPEDMLHGILVAAPTAVGRFAADAAGAVTTASDAVMEGDEKTELREATPLEVHEAIRRHDSLGIPFSKPMRDALTSAAQEADALGHRSIHAEHLVLGLLREEGTQAWRTLNEAGLGLREGRRILREEWDADADAEHQSEMTPIEGGHQSAGGASGRNWYKPVAAGGIALVSGAAVLISVRRAWRWMRTHRERDR